MDLKFLIFYLLTCMTVAASAQSRIVCEPQDKDGKTVAYIWPEPYLSNDELCFDIKVDDGKACVANGGNTSWLTRAVIVDIDGQSQGRDDTWFRVIHPTITSERIEYKIEWTRDGKTWGLMQNVSIDRLSGQAVSWWLTMHGGDSYQCHTESRKI